MSGTTILCYATMSAMLYYLYMASSIMVLYYAILYGSIWYYSIMASLLAAKSMLYMGHLAANRVPLYGDYPTITAVEHYWDKV